MRHHHHHYHHWFGLFLVGRYLLHLGVLGLLGALLVAMVLTALATALLGYGWGAALGTALVFGAVVRWAAA